MNLIKRALLTLWVLLLSPLILFLIGTSFIGVKLLKAIAPSTRR